MIQYQSYVAQARSTEVAALDAYAKAKTQYERSVGLTLNNHNVSIDEAFKGVVQRVSSPQCLSRASPAPSARRDSIIIRMLKIGTVRWRGKCPRHPRFDPYMDGRAAIRGGCEKCTRSGRHSHASHPDAGADARLRAAAKTETPARKSGRSAGKSLRRDLII